MTLHRTCATCGRSAGSDAGWRCACGGPWAVEALGGAVVRARVAGGPRSLWRYREALPVAGDPVTLGEGLTPLLPDREGRLLFKMESANPTGSFKDRGAAVLMTALAGEGREDIVEDSSGNAGSAMAAYAARAGLSATIYVPESASASKVAQAAAYGARVIRVTGSREDVALAAQRAPGRYASHCWDPRFFHGTKTIAYELWEDLGGRAPDWVVSPVGHGTLLLGLWVGFQELVAVSRLSRMPRLVAVQGAACAPLAGPALGQEPGPGSTAAEGIRVMFPVRPTEIRAAVAGSGGHFMVVSDEELGAARTRLAREGLYVEPTAAVAPAAAWHLLRCGRIQPGELVVVPITGHGLKAP